MSLPDKPVFSPPMPDSPSLPPDSLAQAFLFATDALVRVMAGQSLADGLLQNIPQVARPEAQDMVYGTLRRYGEGEALLAPLLRNTPRPGIMALLLLAIYRLESRPEIAHTVVNQAVSAAAFLEGGHYKSLTNGVLRQFLRRREELFAALPEAARLCHPTWWVARLKVAYPESWQSIIAAGNQPPPMALRVNLRKTSQQACCERLQAAGIEVEARGKSGLLLQRPMPVDRLPGFREGELSVQDLGAQRAAEILAPEKGAKVLDACAAPGGKTAHLLEQGEDLSLVAEDIAPARCQRIRENLDRLGLSAQIRVADATRPPSDREEMFDAILADVPCSASGVTRRFPDSKWLRQETDIARFAGTQGKILTQLWTRLQSGGKLLYASCSVFREENQRQIKRFLKQNSNASLLHEEQLLPDAEHDGFYYALLHKQV